MKKNKNKIILKSENDCTGCGACIAACPCGAIIQKNVGFGSWIPKIKQDLCTECGLCQKVCQTNVINEKYKKKAYIAYNRNRDMRLISASGGAFSSLATYVLENNGCVFGAELWFDKKQAIIEHVMIDRIENLFRILGSKYVQSDCSSAYKLVKKKLQEGKMVLFSGCSCQIAGLRQYLNEVNQEYLYTIDLVCHGVPGKKHFNDYITYIENKYSCKISGLSFRTKEKGKIIYEISAHTDRCNSLDCNKEEIKISIRESAYFRMFITEENYRKACYSCLYASLNKPADITVGDYFEAKDDYPELFLGENAIDSEDGISCVITHSKKGNELLDVALDKIFLKEIDPIKVQSSHGNLNRPSKYTRARFIFKNINMLFGYKSLENLLYIRNRFANIIRKILMI